jgi:hypothetical protein
MAKMLQTKDLWLKMTDLSFASMDPKRRNLRMVYFQRDRMKNWEGTDSYFLFLLLNIFKKNLTNMNYWESRKKRKKKFKKNLQARKIEYS